jgi:hypothetical protein
MARDAASKSLGVPVDHLKKIATPNEWAKGQAFAAAVGTYSSPSDECVARARKCKDPNVDEVLSGMRSRPFPNQLSADRWFMAELANRRHRTPSASNLVEWVGEGLTR